MAKHYLVTGGSGFIGAYLVRNLVEEGNKVTVLDNLARGRAARLKSVENDIEFITTDIRDEEKVKAVSKGVDCVYHLAAVNGTENFYTQSELVLDVGIRGMLSISGACKANDIGHMIVASSAEVYQTPAIVPTDETVALCVPNSLEPRYSYGGSKLVSELIAFNYAREALAKVQVFRPHNIYGPDMGWKHVLPQFILRANKQIQSTPTGPVPFDIIGSGEETRAFCYVDDLVNGLRIMEKKGEHRNIYHIGTQEEVTVREVATAVMKCLGHEINIIPSDPHVGATPRRCPDIGKMALLGYKPKTSLEEGVRLTAKWYVENADFQPENALL